jgi:hypothetical protein
VKIDLPLALIWKALRAQAPPCPQSHFSKPLPTQRREMLSNLSSTSALGHSEHLHNSNHHRDGNNLGEDRGVPQHFGRKLPANFAFIARSQGWENPTEIGIGNTSKTARLNNQYGGCRKQLLSASLFSRTGAYKN